MTGHATENTFRQAMGMLLEILTLTVYYIHSVAHSTEILSDCQLAIFGKINLKIELVFPIAIVHNPARFHENCSKMFASCSQTEQTNGKTLPN